MHVSHAYTHTHTRTLAHSSHTHTHTHTHTTHTYTHDIHTHTHKRPRTHACLHTRARFVHHVKYTVSALFKFYHACDVKSKYRYCLLDYAVLAHADFFCAIFAFCVTTIEMAALSAQFRVTLLTAVAVGLTAGVRWDRTNVVVFLVPNTVTFVIFVTSWVSSLSLISIYNTSRWSL